MGIDVRNLSYIYMKNTPYEKKALDDVSLSIDDKEFVGIIGHTGCGKTTLIQHFNALLKPFSGNILIDGVDIKDSDLKVLRNKVGLVFQYPEHQLFEENVYKDIAFGIRKKNYDDEVLTDKINHVLELVGLDKGILNKSVFDLSGGQKRRVAIAGVLIMEPSILVLDEPAAGLDPSGRDALYEVLKDLHKNNDITVVFVSHSMEDVALLCERVVVMNEGRIYTTGSVKDVYKKSNELISIGLDVPGITRFMQSLHNVIPEIDGDVFRLEDAKNELIKLLEVKKC